jgi:tetratricopeptide (TPR) repeat protein
MKGKIFCLVFILVAFSGSVFSQDADELIAQADEMFLQMSDMDTANKVRELYREAMGKTEDKYEAYWRISRIHYFIGTHTEGKKEKQATFAQGVYYGKKAIAEEPGKPDGHYWLAVNNGKYGEAKGIMKSLSLVKPIKRSLNKVIELDRNYEDGGADRVLGRVFFKLPGIAGGSKDKSMEHLEKSKELGPDDPVTRVYLAETYLAKKKVEEARAELEYVLNMEDDPRWVVGLDHARKDAEELLKDKKFRKK